MLPYFNRFINYIWIGIILGFHISCSNDIGEINKLISKQSVNLEEAFDIEMLYSDSAIVRVKINSPHLIRHIDKKNPIDEFPDGIDVEFFDDKKRVQSWLTADYAIRYEKENKIVVQKNVLLHNRKNEKIESGELIWNESTGTLKSDQFVRVTLPEKGDTIYGYGIEVDQDFTTFEVKRKFSGTFNIEDISNSLK